MFVQLIISGGILVSEAKITGCLLLGLFHHQRSHLSRFCHSCGSAFPMVHVRFCCQCGAKRLQTWKKEQEQKKSRINININESKRFDWVNIQHQHSSWETAGIKEQDLKTPRVNINKSKRPKRWTLSINIKLRDSRGGHSTSSSKSTLHQDTVRQIQCASETNLPCNLFVVWRCRCRCDLMFVLNSSTRVIRTDRHKDSNRH